MSSSFLVRDQIEALLRAGLQAAQDSGALPAFDLPADVLEEDYGEEAESEDVLAQRAGHKQGSVPRAVVALRRVHNRDCTLGCFRFYRGITHVGFGLSQPVPLQVVRRQERDRPVHVLDGLGEHDLQ